MPQTIESRFTVNYTFPIIFSRHVFDPADRLLAGIFLQAAPRPHRTLTFIDSGVLAGRPELELQIRRYAHCHSDAIELVVPALVIEGGEVCKNDPGMVPRIHEQLERHHLCRQSFVLAIGGGAVLDTVGFAAATAHRGLRLIRMPTTVLAQNDAGVGVKNGINAFGRKNFLGTFAPPFAVINDFAFLDTLPERDLRAGIVEAVKVALIKDYAFFDFLYRQRHQLSVFDPEVMEEMIRRCAELHIEHITTQGDPFEFGSARPLDFGHWSAHKLEELTRGKLNHGEAVAIGIGLDSLYSSHCSMIEQAELDMILTALEDLGFNLYHPALEMMDVDRALREFQEHLGGELNITLLTGLGRKAEVHDIDIGLMKHCIDLLAKRHRGRRAWLQTIGPGRQGYAQPAAAGTAAM